MPRSELRKQRTRSALLDAARSLFAERGFEGTTIAAIGERADLGFGTFYLYFRDKEDILRAVVMEGLASLRDRLASLDGTTGGVLESGSAALRAVLHHAYDNRDLFRVLLNSRTLSSALEAQAIFRDLLIDQLAALIGRSEAEIAARFVNGVVNQAIVWWFDHDEPGPDAMAARAERFILFGLLGEPTRPTAR
ncbi:MAG: TetR family transcriptional regulator [Dehalococcoidia bacterium]|nr:MAG: TetR family transcriptional regulator [Dehalococcoidia bacterium]